MIFSAAGGRGGTGRPTIAIKGGLEGGRFCEYLPFTRAFSQAQVEGKIILEYDNHQKIKKVLVGLWENLRQQIQKETPS